MFEIIFKSEDTPSGANTPLTPADILNALTDPEGIQGDSAFSIANLTIQVMDGSIGNIAGVVVHLPGLEQTPHDVWVAAAELFGNDIHTCVHLEYRGVSNGQTILTSDVVFRCLTPTESNEG